MAVDWYKDEYLNVPIAMVGSQVTPTPTPASYNPMANDMFKPVSTQIANNPSTPPISMQPALNNVVAAVNRAKLGYGAANAGLDMAKAATAPQAQAAEVIANTGGTGGAAGGGSGSGAASTAPSGYYTAKSQADLINELYDNAKKSAQAQLESAYAERQAGIENAKRGVDSGYRAATEQAGINSEIARANLNRAFAASGINTGAGSQAKLSQANALQRALADIELQKAQKLAEIDTEQRAAKDKYSSAVADAIANNQMQRAKALYDEAIRVENSYVEQKAAASGGGNKAITPTTIPTGTSLDGFAAQLRARGATTAEIAAFMADGAMRGYQVNTSGIGTSEIAKKRR